MMNELVEINRRLSTNLWYITDSKSSPNGLSPRLIFPQKRSEDIRISEQEARTVCCGILNTLNYYYSIETPTEEVYQQTGQKPLSASSDLSLWVYDNGTFNKKVNVEFKAHNPPLEHIRKDIEKLVREQTPGNWHHTLKNIDSGTLPSLFQKFINSFVTLQSSIVNFNISILFCICVIEKKWACMKVLEYSDSVDVAFDKYLNDFFELGYHIKSGQIVIDNNNEWMVFDGMM